MKNRKIVVACCVAVLYLASIGSVRAFSPQPGTADDPLITVSYLNQVMQPLLDLVDELHQQIETSAAEADEEIEALTKRIALLETELLALSETAAVTPVPAPAPEPETTPAPVETVYGHINASWVNIRSGPGTNFSVLFVLPQDTKVIVVRLDKDWYEIRHNNRRGFVHSPLLSVQ